MLGSVIAVLMGASWAHETRAHQEATSGIGMVWEGVMLL